MGKSVTPTYRLEYWTNTKKTVQIGQFMTTKNCIAWPCGGQYGYGRPTMKNLEKRIEGMNRSFLAGGVNFHLSKAEGFIIQINKAQIRKQSTGEVMVQWNAPAFSILSAHSEDHRTLKEMTAPCS